MKKIIAVFAVILTACVLSGLLLFAAADSYSTASDPLVTLSYVNSVLKGELRQEVLAELTNELKAEMKEEIINSLNIDISELTKPETPEEPADETPAGSLFEVVMLTEGQKLMSKGSCEVSLRSGSARVVVTDAVNIAAKVGLGDFTSGEELLNNDTLPQKHLVIIPRGDGRGVVVTSGEAYFMVRGEYEVVAE